MGLIAEALFDDNQILVVQLSNILNIPNTLKK